MIQYLEFVENKVTLVSNTLLLIIAIPLVLLGLMEALTHTVSVCSNFTLKLHHSGTEKSTVMEHEKFFSALSDFKIKSMHWSRKMVSFKHMNMTDNYKHMHNMMISRLVKVRKDD